MQKSNIFYFERNLKLLLYLNYCNNLDFNEPVIPDWIQLNKAFWTNVQIKF